MYGEDTSIAIDRFVDWLLRPSSVKRVRTTAEEAGFSASIKFCLFLIYYFSLCDFILKFLPLEIAIILRYLPEAALYIYVLFLLVKKRQIVSFPLFWPLVLCALTMAISTVLNSSSKIVAIEDYRLFFRFTAFAYIGWRVEVTPQAIKQFLRGFLGLTVIELAVGGLELLGGETVQNFFAPILGLTSGAAATAGNQVFGESGWIFGTLSNYNFYGMFMAMSCVFALALYFIERSRRYLWLVAACALAVVLSYSRHSLLLLVLSLGCFSLLRMKRFRLGAIMKAFVGVVLLVAVLIGVAEHFSPAFEERIATVVSPDVLSADSVQNIRFYMMAILTPRFLSSYPFFGQGPIAPADAVQFGDADTRQGPLLKAAPDLPGFMTFYVGDVVWLMILGLYGCFGLAAFGYVLWTIGAAANRIRKQELSADNVVLAQCCMAIIVIFVVAGFFSEEIVARDCIPVFWVLAGLTLSASSAVRPRTNSFSPN